VVLVDYGRNEARILQRYLKHVGLKDVYFAPVPGDQIPLTQALERIDKPMDLVIVNAREGASRVKKVLEELKHHKRDERCPRCRGRAAPRGLDPSCGRQIAF